MTEDQIAAMRQDIEWIKERLQRGDCFLEKLDKIMSGNGTLGMVAKVNILWCAYAWVTGIAGTAVGAAVTLAVTKLLDR